MTNKATPATLQPPLAPSHMVVRLPIGTDMEVRNASGALLNDQGCLEISVPAITPPEVNLSGLGLTDEVQGMLVDAFRRAILIQQFAARIQL